nr:reverse transcriptase domain-containing protein [Tanacetum cinerariifolium]
NGAHVGYNCPTQVHSFQTLPSFLQQYPRYEDCGVLPEADHCQTPQYTVNHPIFNAHNDLLNSRTTLMEQMTQLTSMCAMVCQIIQKKHEEKKIEEEQAANARYWNIPAYCDDDDDYNSAITPNEPVDSLSIGDEHLNTIPAMESDEFIQSSVENLVPNPSESEGENGCDVCACFTTFSNILFDAEYEFDSVDDQSCSNEDVLEKIFSNPLFEEEIIPIKIDQHHFNAESDLIESLLNHDSSIIPSSSKIDSLLDEFADELTLLKSIPPRIDKTDCYPEEDIRLIDRLLYDNSSPRPPKEFVSENSDADIESFSLSPIPDEDSDSRMEEIDLSFNPDDLMPPRIKEDDDDSERDILILKELLDNYSLSLPENESFYFDIPSFSRPPSKPPDVVQYSRKFEDSYQRILSSKSLFSQLQLGIIEAWDRFKDLLRACPHHGFSELHQLDTFYNALNLKDQDSLNSAAGGNFLDKMLHGCLAIIESKSKIRYSRNKPVVAKVSTNTSTFGISPDVVELKDMVKALLLDKKSKNQANAIVKAVEESCVTCGGAHSYRNCPATDGNVYRENIQEFVYQASTVNYNQGNTRNKIQSRTCLSTPVFQSPAYQAPAYQAPAPQIQGFSKEDFSAYVKANDAVMGNMQTQGQKMQNQLTYQTELITKFVNSKSASTSSAGTLPSNTIANPRSDLKAITTRSGVSYDGHQILPPSSFLPKVVENKPEATKDTVTPTNNVSTEDVKPSVVQIETLVIQISKPVIAPVSAPKPNQKSSIPYPSRRNDERNREKANNQIEKFYQIFKDMSFEISFAVALILMSKFASTLKALIRNKEKLSEMARTSLNEHCSAVLLKKLPEKLGDLGKFLIPCDFPRMDECLALADLGASINLMLLSVWKRLSLPELNPTCLTLELADRSISRPIGIAEDVYVKVRKFHFSADFVVVDFDADP